MDRTYLSEVMMAPETKDRPKVILIYPKSEGVLTGLKRMRPMPLGLLNASIFMIDDYNVVIIDQNLHADWKQRIRQALTPDTVLVGVYAQALGAFLFHSLEVSRYVRSLSSVPIVWGGVFPSIAPDIVLKEEFVDYVCIREGEQTLPELTRAIVSQQKLDDIPGLCYRENGQLKFTPERPFVDLNELPDLPYHLVSVPDYNAGFVWKNRKGEMKLQLETSRGCERNCSFCYHAQYSKRIWRSQCAEKVLERIDRLVADYGATHIDFIDDAFFTDNDRIEKIAKGLLNRDYRIRWLVQGADVDRIANMDDSYLKLLEAAGLRTLRLGAESGSTKVLQSIRKVSTAEELVTANKKLSKYKIAPWYYFTVGMKGETYEDMRQTINMLFRLLKENPRARLATTFCLSPVPGTKLFEEACADGYVPPASVQECSQVDGTVIVTPWFTDREKRDRNFIGFLGYFIDKKNREAMDSAFVRMMAELYRPVAVYRMKSLKLGFPLEYKLYEIMKRLRK